jgi:DNA topoisomerase-1
MNLVIVESPAKAKSISSYLGKNYIVRASLGHIKDLPRKKLGIDINNNFEPNYEVIYGKGKTIKDLVSRAKNAEKVFLATDPDREGEAISWHLEQEIKKVNSNISRVTFNEITKKVVREAVTNPKNIDYNMVNAQQARRLLDRLVGYKVSPLLWKNFKGEKGLSAGRVQSVALKLVYELEKEIENFDPEEYWSIDGEFFKDKEENSFSSKLDTINGKKISKNIKNEETAKKILSDIKSNDIKIKNIDEKTTNRYPYAPFTTNSLQQEASSKLGIKPKDTMKIAQKLYEGFQFKGEHVGLITYMRTDSTNISDVAITEARSYIKNNIGEDYLPSSKKTYATKGKSAQEAHEAIRPTHVEYTPNDLKGVLNSKQLKMYELIWRRFVACQMENAKFASTTIILSAGEKYEFKTTGSQMLFDGYLKIYKYVNSSNTLLPANLEEEDILQTKEIDKKQHFTNPPTRFTEATLVKELDDKGIGRPSTYATIISNIQDKNYVKKYKKKYLQPTELGVKVIEYLLKHFDNIFKINFTAQMENDLDTIANGDLNWKDMLANFYKEFLITYEPALEKANKVQYEKANFICPDCGSDVYIRNGNYGKFYACSSYPKCKFSRSVDSKKKKSTIKKTGKKCPDCSSELVIRKGKYGEFYSCSNYPKCKYSKPIKEKKKSTIKKTGKSCPDCSSELVIRKGKYGEFYSCSNYPKCTYTKPLKVKVVGKCPKCGGEVLEKKTKKDNIFFGCNNYPKCDFATWKKNDLK